MLKLSLSLLACCQMSTGNSHPQPFILNASGIGPITMSSLIHIEGKEAVLEASARNDTGQAIRRADSCVLERLTAFVVMPLVVFLRLQIQLQIYRPQNVRPRGPVGRI